VCGFETEAFWDRIPLDAKIMPYRPHNSHACKLKQNLFVGGPKDTNPACGARHVYKFCLWGLPWTPILLVVAPIYNDSSCGSSHGQQFCLWVLPYTCMQAEAESTCGCPQGYQSCMWGAPCIQVLLVGAAMDTNSSCGSSHL
jgi:hypothetical protein